MAYKTSFAHVWNKSQFITTDFGPLLVIFVKNMLITCYLSSVINMVITNPALTKTLNQAY